ncbi:hypothetical protein NDU88_001765 [Pleurodeles waltl]|uniref:Uncharacterized protein n=1 Tax=Pleurodeles waltl TaxID=8319 RepID=A0AAV7MTN3_PLEWA|nr:hypothetical protein NDU88_001765 [Pleurodeles waltl]
MGSVGGGCNIQAGRRDAVPATCFSPEDLFLRSHRGAPSPSLDRLTPGQSAEPGLAFCFDVFPLCVHRVPAVRCSALRESLRNGGFP